MQTLQSSFNLPPLLLIIRGLPGSGKSTEAKRYAQEHAIATTDDYPGLYSVYAGTLQFNGSEMLGEFPMIAHAHKANEKKVRELMKAQEPCIVVPNTSTRHWESHLYIEMAKEFGYNDEQIDLYDAGLSDVELYERCVHNVPIEVIAKMRSRYQRGPRSGGSIKKKHSQSDFANSPAMKFAKAYEEYETKIREGYENNAPR